MGDAACMEDPLALRVSAYVLRSRTVQALTLRVKACGTGTYHGPSTALFGHVVVVRGVVKNVGFDSFVDLVKSGSETVRLLLVILDHKRYRWRVSFNRQSCIVPAARETAVFLLILPCTFV